MQPEQTEALNEHEQFRVKARAGGRLRQLERWVGGLAIGFLFMTLGYPLVRPVRVRLGRRLFEIGALGHKAFPSAGCHCDAEPGTSEAALARFLIPSLKGSVGGSFRFAYIQVAARKWWARAGGMAVGLRVSDLSVIGVDDSITYNKRVLVAGFVVEQLKTEIEQYVADHGRPPATTARLSAMMAAKRLVGYRSGNFTYPIGLPLDPWGHPYLYASPGPRGESYVVGCYGADGKPGGTGFATDLVDRGPVRTPRPPRTSPAANRAQ